MSNCIFAGSFDPITLGHMDIIKRAARDFDIVYVAVAEDTGKDTASLSDRLKLVNMATQELTKVQAITFSGMITDLCRALKTYTLVRGIRNIVDFEYEKNLLLGYQSQNRDMDCVYYISAPQLMHVSSSATKQILSLNGDISGYVPASVLDMVAQIYRRGMLNGRAVQSIGG